LIPEHVSQVHRQLPPCPTLVSDPSLQLAARAVRALGRDVLSRELQFAALGKGWYAMRPFYGYTGRPHHATARAGEVFVRAILDRYASGVPAVLDGEERSPPPIMSWINLVSFGGRLAGLEVPTDQMFRLKEE
jgi:hypothetical protein